jgi:hypothetical protein
MVEPDRPQMTISYYACTTYGYRHTLRNCNSYYFSIGARGGVLIKALRYKPAGRGFDS